MNRYDYEAIPDAIINQARGKCPDHLTEYDRYAAEINEQYHETHGDESANRESPKEGSTGEPDTSLTDELAHRGVEDATVRQLGAMATLTGYNLADPLPFETAQSIAMTMLTFCDQVATSTPL